MWFIDVIADWTTRDVRVIEACQELIPFIVPWRQWWIISCHLFRILSHHANHCARVGAKMFPIKSRNPILDHQRTSVVNPVICPGHVSDQLTEQLTDLLATHQLVDPGYPKLYMLDELRPWINAFSVVKYLYNSPVSIYKILMHRKRVSHGRDDSWGLTVVILITNRTILDLSLMLSICQITDLCWNHVVSIANNRISWRSAGIY